LATEEPVVESRETVHRRMLKSRPLRLVALVVATVIIVTQVGLTRDQITSVALFSLIIYGTILFWPFRLGFAFLGLVGLFGFGVLDIPTFVGSSGFDIIFFLVAMMIVIGFLEETRFFENLLKPIVKAVSYNPKKFVIALMLMSTVFAALVDEVTSILFMTAMTLHLTGRYKVRPEPFIMMVVFATNIGSSATVVGNPVGVMIALNAGLTFSDFLRWAAPISAVGILSAIGICMWYFRGPIKDLEAAMKTDTSLEAMDSQSGEVGNQHMKRSWLLFLGTLTSLVAHKPIEDALGLKSNTMLLGVAFAAAGIVLLLEREKARELVEKRVDWWTLAFFALLFASVGTLKFVGLTKVIAGSVVSFAGTGSELLLALIWIAGVLSAFLDNVLAVALFIPIVADLGALGVNVFPLWWGMLFAGTFFGNLTIIGSTANIVAVGMLERRKRGHIGFGEWIKAGAIVSFATLALASLLLILQLPLMG